MLNIWNVPFKDTSVRRCVWNHYQIIWFWFTSISNGITSAIEECANNFWRNSKRKNQSTVEKAVVFLFVRFGWFFSLSFLLNEWIGWLFGWAKRLHNVWNCVCFRPNSNAHITQQYAIFTRKPLIVWVFRHEHTFDFDMWSTQFHISFWLGLVLVLMTRYSHFARTPQHSITESWKNCFAWIFI